MSIFKRLRDLTLSNVYALIDKAEDPVKMTDQYLRNMEADLEDAEKAVAAQISLEKKFKRLLEEQEELFKKREEQAHAFVQANNIELARKALEEKKIAEEKIPEYRKNYEENRFASENLREKLVEMRKQIDDLKHKRESLVARASAAKAKKEISRVTSSMNISSSAIADFQRMEDKVAQLEAEAEVSHELASQGGPSLDKEYEKLNKNKEIEAELEELMKKYAE